MIVVSNGTQPLLVPQQAMRLRRAVPKILAKSSVPPTLPLHKNRPRPTPSKSTLLQVLIPLHFNSPRINAYKKPGRGAHCPAPKFRNSSLYTCGPCAPTPTPATPIPSMVYFTVLWIRGGGGTHFRPNFAFRFSYFEFAAFVSVGDFNSRPSTASYAYFPRNFSRVESSASAMSKYFFALLVSCFCIAACALEISVLMRCCAETM